MPSRQQALRQLMSLGVKYAPLAYEGLKHGRQPAQQFAERQLTRRNARSIAMEHAAHLVDGSVLPVYDGDQRVWVVFSGDLPVGTHPRVATPLEELLLHYDLDKRIAPSSPSGRKRKRRPGKTGGNVPGEPTGTGWPAAGTEGASETPGS